MQTVHEIQQEGIRFIIGIPDYPLNLWVDHFFVSYGNPGFSQKRVFPNNNVDIFFNLGSLNKGKLEHATHGFDFKDTVVSGLRSSFMSISPTGSFDIAGMRFKLFGFSSLFDIPAIEIANENLCAYDVLGSEANRIWQRLTDCTNPCARLSVLEDWMLKITSSKSLEIKLWNRIEQKFRSLEFKSKSALSSELGYSYKHSLKLITQMTGLHPKVIDRVYRINYLLRAISRQPSVHWAKMACHFGYSDQSHMIKEFKTFTGFTPVEFKSQTRILTENALR